MPGKRWLRMYRSFVANQRAVSTQTLGSPAAPREPQDC
jgi:hypothetical protein